MKINHLLLAVLIAAAAVAQEQAPRGIVAAGSRAQPPEAALERLRLVLQGAMTPDVAERNRMAKAALSLAAETPDILIADNGNGGNGLQTLFEILSKQVLDAQGKQVAQAVYPEWQPYWVYEELRASSSRAAERKLTDERKQLYDKLCDLALQHPEWAEIALRPLTARHLMDQIPKREELLLYARKALKSQPGRGPAIIQKWLLDHEPPASIELCLQLVDLVLPLIADAWKGHERIKLATPTGLGRLIGDRARLPRLDSLWEWPHDITDGPNSFSPNQITLNQHRRQLMDQLWKTSQNIPVLRREVFPDWAAYRLYFIEDAEEVITAARSIESSHHECAALVQSLIFQARFSRSNTHHILMAETIEAMLRDRPEAIPLVSAPSRFSRTHPFAELVRLLLKGSELQSTAMPPLSAPEEVTDRVLGASWQKRRLEVIARLRELLGTHHALPADLLFMQLRETLLSGDDAQKVEQSLRDTALKASEDFETALQSFIWTINGGDKETGQNTSRGVWDLKRRLLMFETAFRLGEPLLTISPFGRERWLGDWTEALMQGGPGVPPFIGSTYAKPLSPAELQTYEATPMIPERDALLVRGLNVETRLKHGWQRHHLEFTFYHLRRGTAGKAVLRDWLSWLAQSQSGSDLFHCLGAWKKFKNPDPPVQLALAEVLLETMRFAPTASLHNSFGEQVHAWRHLVLNKIAEHDGGVKDWVIPLLPEQPWLSSGHFDYDSEMSQPLARERLAVWKQLVEQMAGVPTLGFACFDDLARLHVSSDPAKLMRIALSFSDEQFFYAEGRMLSEILREEHRAPLARRADWGRLAVLWVAEAAKRGGKTDPKFNHSRWCEEILQYLRREPEKNGLPAPPATTPEDRSRLEEAIRQLISALANDPASSTEGFVSHIRRRFHAGAKPDEFIVLARYTPSAGLDHLQKSLHLWCQALGDDKTTTSSELVWAADILASVAEQWPESPDYIGDAYWMAAAAKLIGQSMKSVEKAALRQHLQRMLEAGFRRKRPPIEFLGNIARHGSAEPLLAERLKTLCVELATRNTPLAGEWMLSWLSPGPHIFEPEHDRLPEARVALEILQKWPAAAPPSSLTWTEGLVLFLSPGVTDISPDQMHLRMHPFFPAPGSTKEEQELQRKVIQRILPALQQTEWVRLLSMRLHLQTSAEAAPLKHWFSPKELSVTLQAMRHALSPERTAFGPHITPLPQGFPTQPDHDAAEGIDITRCFLLTRHQKWLSPQETLEMTELCRRNLQQSLARAAARTEELNNWPKPPPFELPGVLPEQEEAARLLLQELDKVSP